MTLNEAETHTDYESTPLYICGVGLRILNQARGDWPGAVEILEGRPHRRSKGRADYTLRVKVTPDSQPVAMAIIEAKAEHLPPDHGLEQAKVYAASKRLNVPFVFHQRTFIRDVRSFHAHNHQAVPCDRNSLSGDVASRLRKGYGFFARSHLSPNLLQRYSGGEATRRYYQDAAIRAVLEKIANGEKTGLTGFGDWFRENIHRGQSAQAHRRHRAIEQRALFICDRDELRARDWVRFQNVFGADAAEVSGGETPKECPHIDRHISNFGILIP